MVQNYADSRQLIDRDQYSVASDKEVLSKKLYNKLMPNSCKQNLKKKKECFEKMIGPSNVKDRYKIFKYPR